MKNSIPNTLCIIAISLFVCTNIDAQSMISHRTLVDEDPDSTVSQQLFEAIRHGDATTVQNFITTSPTLINTRDTYGNTPLIKALFLGLAEIANLLLLINDIDVNAKNCTGQTALMNAARGGFSDLVRELTRKGAHITLINNEGHTAYELAQIGLEDAIQHSRNQNDIARFQQTLELLEQKERRLLLMQKRRDNAQPHPNLPSHLLHFLIYSAPYFIFAKVLKTL